MMTDILPENYTRGSGLLSIDLNAIASNYRALRTYTLPADCGACVKADCYGLGLNHIAPVLASEGCKDFFVSFLEGGERLRKILPDVRIHVFTGLSGGPAEQFKKHNLIPVLNSLRDIKIWGAFCIDQSAPMLCDIHVDTGMLRLGLPPDELFKIREKQSILDGLNVDTIMSHLACADDKSNKKNSQQLASFHEAIEVIHAKRISLANSSGIFLGKEYHFDLVRPGAALYGINPTPNKPSPISQVICLKGKILQVRSVDTHQTVGYGATHQVTEAGRIATVGVGYADGYLRASNTIRTAYIGNIPVPVVGRVSMDVITLNVSSIPEKFCQPGMTVDLIGPNHDVDSLAEQKGTISYELLTSLGNRFQRVYKGGC